MSEAWWTKGWSAEEFNHANAACCQRPAFSNYSIPRLKALVDRGLNLAFSAASLGLDPTGVPGLGALSQSSGGNALLIALTLCSRVSLYGSGLLRLDPTQFGDKSELVYAHFYDAGAGRCRPISKATIRKKCTRLACQEARLKWRQDRIATELLFYLLDALQIINWVP